MTNWQRSERTPALVAHPPAASLDEAHLAIELWEHYARKKLDPDQRLAVELMLAETSDGRWAADTTGRAESRQNGKGDEIEVVELWGLTQRAEAILHTAHEAATAASAHERLVSLVEGHRDLSRMVTKKQSWNGNYSLRLDNDAVIVWRTRTGAGGRGLDDISRIVIDEAQHAQPEELASSLPILSVNPNPQKNFIGSGGVAGKSGFWWRQRRRALQSHPGRFAWLEHSAESVSLGADGRVVSTVGDVRDPETWRRANPAYPSRISHDFLLDQLATLGEELFAREHLCVWDPEPGVDGLVIPLEDWHHPLCEVPSATFEQVQGRPVFAVDVTPDKAWTSIAVAGLRSDGRPYVEVVEHARGTGWAPKRLVEIRQRWNARILADLSGPAGSLDADCRALGLELEAVSAREVAQACGFLYDATVEHRLVHRPDVVLDAALAGAVKRDVADGAWCWSRKNSTVVISPLVAATIAVGSVGAKAAPVFAY